MARPTRDDGYAGYATTSGLVNAAGHVEVACGGAVLRIVRVELVGLAPAGSRSLALGAACDEHVEWRRPECIAPF